MSEHAGNDRPFPYQSLPPPIVQTATYTFKDTADLRSFMDARMWGLEAKRIEYGRYGNPTILAVEAKLAALERGEEAMLLASCVAGITTTMLSLLKAGDHYAPKNAPDIDHLLTRYAKDLDAAFLVTPTFCIMIRPSHV